MGNKFRTEFGDTMGEGELNVRRKELLNVRTANIVCLLDLNHSENLHKSDQKGLTKRQKIQKMNIRGSSGSEHGV